MKNKQRHHKKVNFKFVFLIFILVFSSAVVGTSAQEGTSPVDVPAPEIIEQTEEPGLVNTVVRIYPNKDTFVASNFPYNNYGSWSTSRAGRDGTYGATRTLVQFNFNSVPSGAIINSARLYMYQVEALPSNDPPYKLGARYINSDWNEYAVTWSSHEPEWGSVFGEAEISNVNGWKSFDAKTLVQTWISGSRPNYGMMVQGSNENEARERVFATRETSNLPYIDVDYTQYVDTCPPSAWFTSVLKQYSSSSFTVSWDGSDCGSNNQPPSGIRNYDVQYSTNNSNWINWKMDTKDKSGTFYGVNGEIYYFRVRAADNALNIGAWSGSIWTTVDTQPPGNLNLTIGTIGMSDYVYPHFQVSWLATDNLSGVQKYIVQWNDNAGSGWVGSEFPASQTSDSATGADVGKTYSFRMQAVDNAGNVSGWSATKNVTVVNDPSSFVLPFNPAIVPGPEFDVFWQGYSSNTITQFQVKYQVNGGTWQDMGTYPGTQSFAEFDASTLPGWEFTTATIIGFEVAATAQSLPQEPFTGVAEATIVVDPGNTMTNILYMPIVFKDGS